MDKIITKMYVAYTPCTQLNSQPVAISWQSVEERSCCMSHNLPFPTAKPSPHSRDKHELEVRHLSK